MCRRVQERAVLTAAHTSAVDGGLSVQVRRNLVDAYATVQLPGCALYVCTFSGLRMNCRQPTVGLTSAENVFCIRVVFVVYI